VISSTHTCNIVSLLSTCHSIRPLLILSAQLLNYHKKHNIATAAYAPLSAATKAKPGPCDDILSSLATKYGVSENEISLRWCIEQDIVAITTSSKEQRMSDMLRVATFKLTPKEIKEIGDLGSQKHFRG